MLTKDITPYDLNKTLPPKSSLKRNSTVSYDINATNEFPNMSITKKKRKKTHERTRDEMRIATDTPATATIPNEDNISTLLDENNKIEQANITKPISENNKSNKLTFLQMLENNNNKIKQDVMENKIDTTNGNNVHKISNIHDGINK